MAGLMTILKTVAELQCYFKELRTELAWIDQGHANPCSWRVCWEGQRAQSTVGSVGYYELVFQSQDASCTGSLKDSFQADSQGQEPSQIQPTCMFCLASKVFFNV